MVFLAHFEAIHGVGAGHIFLNFRTTPHLHKKIFKISAHVHVRKGTDMCVHVRKCCSLLLGRGLKLLTTMVYVKTFDISIVKAFRQVLQNYPNRIMYVNALTQEEWTYAKVSNYEFGTFKIYNTRRLISNCIF